MDAFTIVFRGLFSNSSRVTFLENVYTPNTYIHTHNTQMNHTSDVSIDCTRKWIGNAAAYIVYVTSLAILRTVTVCGRLAGVTNDKEYVLLQWVSPYCSTQTGSEALLLVLHIDTLYHT